MCGVTGFLDREARASDWPRLLERMAGRLAHRGPDDRGSWHDAEAGAGLAHRRLSVLDPSPEGHQPMVSASGRFVISYNGEVYNFRELRQELDRAGLAPAWRGHSDTEVMLAAIEAWGPLEATSRFGGIFAFAVWDRQERALHLARDPVGVKPLFVAAAADGSLVLFGSELKALREHPGFDGAIDRGSLALYMRLGYVPAPHCIHSGVEKVLPGTVVTFASAETGWKRSERTYWSARKVFEEGARGPRHRDPVEAADALESVLGEAVRSQMVSDVPLGAFLSGGYDSSTVVALMQKAARRPVKTFSIGFREPSFDEAPHAAAVARHLGTDHTELYVSARDGLDLVPRLPQLFDEPFSDASQIPTFLLSELTRRHVTVSLSGDGGDELFFGYPRYFLAQAVWRAIGWIPDPLRCGLSGLAAAMGRLPGSDRIFRALPLVRRHAVAGESSNRFRKLAQVLRLRSFPAVYELTVCRWSDGRIVPDAAPHATPLGDPETWRSAGDPARGMMLADLLTYLPDDILVKVDRASMGVSLEARVPLLDPRVVELAAALPMELKVRDGKGKWILRQVLERHVPAALIDRPKMGFGVPLAGWLRQELREWAEELLGEARLRREGFLNAAMVRQKWTEHLSGAHDWQYLLWDALMFQAWLESQRAGAGGAA